MRVLLDECLPRALKLDLVGHETRTVPEMGWATKENGALLALAAAEQFDLFLTVDRNLSHQQDLSSFNIAVVVMVATSNRLIDVRPLIPRVLEVLPSAARGIATIVEMTAS